MPQHDGVIDNQTFPAVRTDINAFLNACLTNNSGSSAPSSTYSYQWWADTSTNPATLKQRNGANTAWITIGQCDTTNLGLATALNAALTGTPTAPTAAAGTNTTQIATTAMVQSAIGNTPAWIAATLQNGWVSVAGNPVVQYRKYQSGLIHLVGTVRQSITLAAYSSSIVTTLPSGFRPTNGFNIPVILNVANVGYVSGILRIGSDGSVAVTANSALSSANQTDFSIPPILFTADI